MKGLIRFRYLYELIYSNVLLVGEPCISMESCMSYSPYFYIMSYLLFLGSSMFGHDQKWLARITRNGNLGQFWSKSIEKSSHRFSRSLSQLPTTGMTRNKVLVMK